jgi:hypothetical protein
MITSAHAIIYTKDAEKDRAFFRDILEFKWVDSGEGWLIFRLPPAEIACHPAETEMHEIFLMTDNVSKTVKDLTIKGIVCGPVSEEEWGLLTRITLPGGGTLGLYQPHHAQP